MQSVNIFYDYERNGEIPLERLPLTYKLDPKTYGMFVDGLYVAFPYNLELEQKFKDIYYYPVKLKLTMQKFIGKIVDCKKGLYSFGKKNFCFKFSCFF